jgi:hypothetical protein
MKRIFSTLVMCLFMGTLMFAQQHLCAGTGAKQYQAHGIDASSTFSWSISGGGALTNAALATCQVDWSAAGAGTYTLSVVETNSGCSGAQIDYTIVIEPKPTASLTTGIAIVCSGSSTANIEVSFTGTGDWDFVYAIDGVNQTAITGVSTSPYSLVVPDGITSTKVYTLVSVSDNYCGSGTTSGTVTYQVPVFSTSITAM